MSQVSIGVGSHWLTGDAAVSLIACIAEAGTSVKINSSGRTRAEQQALYNRYLADVRAGKKPPRWASKPGTSMHELGIAVDIQTNSALWKYMGAGKGAAADWTRPLLAPPYNETWHFEFHPQPKPTTRKKVRNMLHFALPQGKYVILTSDGRRIDYTSGTSDFPNGIAGIIGNAVAADEAVVSSFQRQLRNSGPTVAAPVVDVITLATTVADQVGDALADSVADKFSSRLKS